MPAPSSATFGYAVTEVLGRIGQRDDGVSNPLLVAEAKGHINAAQRKLVVEHGLQTQRRSLAVAVASGRRFVDLPADCRLGQITEAVWVTADGTEVALDCGIAVDHRNLAPQMPRYYDLTPTLGVRVDAEGGTGYTDGEQPGIVTGGTRMAYGHDPVVTFTVTANTVVSATVIDAGSGWSDPPAIAPATGSGADIAVTSLSVLEVELTPIPQEGGTLRIEYKAAVVELVDDGDLLALDTEAVIGRAATLLAGIKNLPCADRIERDFVSYIMAFRSQQTPGRKVNLASWRRDEPVAVTRWRR